MNFIYVNRPISYILTLGIYRTMLRTPPMGRNLSLIYHNTCLLQIIGSVIPIPACGTHAQEVLGRRICLLTRPWRTILRQEALQFHQETHCMRWRMLSLVFLPRLLHQHRVMMTRLLAPVGDIHQIDMGPAVGIMAVVGLDVSFLIMCSDIFVSRHFIDDYVYLYIPFMFIIADYVYLYIY